jgi:hypothetical protein
LLIDPPVPDVFWLGPLLLSVPLVEPLSMEPAVPEEPAVVESEPLMLFGPDPTVPCVAGAPVVPPAVPPTPVCASARAGADKLNATTAAKILGDIVFLLIPRANSADLLVTHT